VRWDVLLDAQRRAVEFLNKHLKPTPQTPAAEMVVK
jgi:hypothetical protein